MSVISTQLQSDIVIIGGGGAGLTAAAAALEVGAYPKIPFSSSPLEGGATLTLTLSLKGEGTI